MASDNYQIKKTGSDDNERAQINKALRDIFTILERRDQWDAAASWGDHANAGYASELSEIAQFDNLGVPQNLTVTQTLSIAANGTEVINVEATWDKVGDDSLVYDLEIRECDPDVSVDENDTNDILLNTELYSVPIIANDQAESTIRYNTTVEKDLRYWFRVRIRKETLVSAWSSFVNLTATGDEGTPTAPDSLTVSPGPSSAKLEWTFADPDYYENNPSVDYIEIQRGDGTGSPPANIATIETISRPALTYVDGDLNVGNTYQYRVRAVTYNNFVSSWTNWVSTVPVDADFNTPQLPTGLSATSNIITDNTGGQALADVLVTWNVVPGDNITYDINLVEDPLGSATVLNTPVIANPESGNSVRYEFVGKIKSKYRIKVRSRNGTKTSAWTAEYDIDLLPDAQEPGAVSGATVTPLYQGAVLNWDNPSTSNFHYTLVERQQTQPTATQFAEVGKVTRPTSLFFDDGLVVNLDTPHSYLYRLTTYTSEDKEGSSITVGPVTPNNVPDNTITASQIVARSITADEIEINTITATEINTSTITLSSLNDDIDVAVGPEVNVIIRSSSEPTQRNNGSALRDGDTWIRTGTDPNTGLPYGDLPYTYSLITPGNGVWVRSYTTINGGDIKTGTIDADRIDADVVRIGYNVSDLVNDAGYTDFERNETTITIRSLIKPTTRPPLPNQVNGDALVEGDIWIDALNGDTPYTYDGTVPYDPDGWIQAYTIIDGGNITTGTIDASQVNVINIDADNINTGTIGAAQLEDGSIGSVKFTSTIESDNYVAGSSGWIIGVDNGAAEFSNIVARGNFISGTVSPTADRIELTAFNSDYPLTLDRDYRIWVGAGTRNQANGRFWVDADGNAKFGGRVRAAQLEGSFLDAVPFDLTSPVATDNPSTVNWVTIGDRYLEFPETIDRPRRGFISAAIPVFDNPLQPSQGAEIRVQAQIQNSNGTWPSTWTNIVQVYTVNTDPIGNATPVAVGTPTTGLKGFRFRVQFRAIASGQTPRANRYTGIFLALPSITGFNVKVDSTGAAASGGTAPSSPTLLVPPDFGDGWLIP